MILSTFYSQGIFSSSPHQHQLNHNGREQTKSFYFVSDFDGTIAHYEVSDGHQSEVIPLPASSGSGKVAYISSKTLELLAEISQHIESMNKAMVCASGQRVATMKQRQPYFPFFKYWISENGGRIHNDALEEIAEWTEYVDSDETSKQALESFVSDITGLGLEDVKIDRTGYFSMVRIKAGPSSFDQIIQMIPATLKYTFNLGYLDVQLRLCGKLQAVRWLLNWLERRKGISNTADSPFMFMGDDDNDVEVASQAVCAFIAQPCSPAMRSFVEGVRRQQHEHREEAVVPALRDTEYLGLAGTEDLLAAVLHQLCPQEVVAEASEIIMQTQTNTLPISAPQGERVGAVTVISRLSNFVSFFRRPKWLIVLILVSIIAAL